MYNNIGSDFECSTFSPAGVWFLGLKISKFFHFLHMVLTADNGHQIFTVIWTIF